MMRRNFTLPELEERLDRLTAGSLFEIGSGDYERLFGSNDAAVARLRNFARSHACVNQPFQQRNLVPQADRGGW